MDIKKSFLTLEEQIECLKNKEILVVPEEEVYKILSKNSYYNIVNGYGESFLFAKDPKKYLKNVSFFEIYSLYLFDDNLRNILWPYILEIEKNIKSEIVSSFFSSKNSKGEMFRKNFDYLNIDNYDKKEILLTISVISNLHKTIASYLDRSDSIKHYLEKYSFVPLWVILNHMTFSEISKLYTVLQLSDRQAISKRYELSENELRLMLKLISEVRNVCAHRNRLYCFRHRVTLPSFDVNKHYKEHIFSKNGVANSTLFPVIISISILLNHKIDKLLDSIDSEISELTKKIQTIKVQKILDCMGFPKNWKELKY